MSDQYIVTISRKSADRPLDPGVIFEWGVSTDDAAAFAQALAAFAEILKINGTPERSVAFMRHAKLVAELRKKEIIIIKGK